MERTVRLVIPMLLLLALSATAAAAPRPGDAGPRGDDRRGGRVFADGGLTLDEAVARAEKRFGARAVRAENAREGDRVVYRIRLLSEDGRVFEVKVDARTGAFL